MNLGLPFLLASLLFHNNVIDFYRHSFSILSNNIKCAFWILSLKKILMNLFFMYFFQQINSRVWNLHICNIDTDAKMRSSNGSNSIFNYIYLIQRLTFKEYLLLRFFGFTFLMVITLFSLNPEIQIEFWY